MVTLEVTLGSEDIPALLVDGSLDLGDRLTVNGGEGSVHANDDLTLQGRVDISGNATATGLYTESGQASVGGVARPPSDHGPGGPGGRSQTGR